MRAIMLAGTGSDVGKSILVAGLARAFYRRGLKVCPFKPQNMSNNATVTSDGGEIGRAQALQARAARVPPRVHMNPVLLKPQSETGFSDRGARARHRQPQGQQISNSKTQTHGCRARKLSALMQRGGPRDRRGRGLRGRGQLANE